jgi:cytochrome c-type biogenesis protein CcmH/NrfG
MSIRRSIGVRAIKREGENEGAGHESLKKTGTYSQGSLWRRWQSSRLLFEHALAVTATNPVVHSNLAQALFAEGDWKGAEADAFYETLLRESPDHADALRQRGMVAMKAGDPEKATACFQAALRLRPGDSRLQEALSRVEKGPLQKKLDRNRH